MLLKKHPFYYIKKKNVMSFSFFAHCNIKKNDKAYQNIYNLMFYYNNIRYNTNINLTQKKNNLFEEELTKVFKEYPILKRNNISHYEEILIKEDDINNKYKIGDIICIDDHTFGVVLQINQNNTIIGKIYQKNIKNKYNNNNIINININEKRNVYSPYEYLKYLFSKHNNKLNIFHHNNKEIYHKKSIKKQLHSNIFLIDIFNKIKYGQKICVITEKDKAKNVMLISLIYENLLINTICKNENLFIICSNIHKSELKLFFQELHELFRQMVNKSGKNNNNNNNNNKGMDNINNIDIKMNNMYKNNDIYKTNIVDKLYSENYIYDDIKIPNDILWINSTTHYDTQYSCYLAPILTTYNLNEYKKKYKNIIMVFYNVTRYNEIVTDLQNYMNIFMKNYYNNKKKEEIENKIKKNIWKDEFFITSLPLSAHSIISKYLSHAMYPHYMEKEEDEVGIELKNNKYIYDSTSYKNNKTDIYDKNDMSYTLDSYKYYDYINLNISNLQINNISNSVSSFCFIDKTQHELSRINDYALSLCDNYISLIDNKYNINPEMDMNSFLHNKIIENNQIWYIVKKDIQDIFNKRDEYIKLIENKGKMNIYIDHWEEENFVHYNNIYYIIVYKNFNIFNLNSFQLLVLLRSLIYSNFTNPNISKDHIHFFYEQFFHYYYQNFKYFSILHDEYYKNLKKFKQIEGAQEFINKVDTVMKYIKPNFKNQKNFI
ncbi:conserved Plasmodium protein, unknown function [Plasmodium sp. gorilla clade G2]|uniref:conserved Plasmodium protein, unknown function n=1 Tax=Plasmodium sp. gorilla clade G2 TaxID=880535 RepID=UPI000D2169C6|nr:conserved Plasmodium protein, unknown function [Plasmodium sp. gorilla clade G2]SOV18034.1 conserved Plasmodium protein, unknown function [Plasmodium sp. gorilla clade G2]